MEWLEAKKITERIRAAKAEAKALKGPLENKIDRINFLGVTDDSEPEAENADPLEDVDFASPAARNRASELGMTAESFKRRKRSSDRGFTSPDVARIAETLGVSDDD